MREYAPGKWESAHWPSEQHSPADAEPAYLNFAYSPDPYTAMCQAITMLPACNLAGACGGAAQSLDAQAQDLPPVG